ncbi:MAG: 1-deoxy-D-xylulose-5-phosphate synthase [Oscillospiraceae bacterium]|nr:1-deoxy-D-xylulose-5-phosphate synthase [Oscillospiraceae bacterium]
MNILDANVKKMTPAQLERLAKRIRCFLLAHVSQTGGHLAPSLGAVDLIVALHKVFDTSVDRVVFDVGHQAYSHKILTGRREGFDKLRQWGEMSGFPCPNESVHDAFVGGHASTSISLALGMARAERLKGSDARCIAVLGDGALTGGLAYEAINDAGHSREPLIVVLNDNGMSISRNVGGMSKHLARLRSRPQYIKMKIAYHKLTDPLPGGKTINRALHRMKRGVRDTILSDSSLFESMGFAYLGPADGHNIDEMVELFRHAKSLKRPVLIHLMTRKGKGYKQAEQNPSAFHGVPAFDLQNGLAAKNGETFSDRFGKTLCKLAQNDKKIVAITAAMPDGTGLCQFVKQYPSRFFDVGIAEGHAVTMAAAMAKQGIKPVVAVYSSFLQRAYDHILHDVAIGNLPVVFCVDRAGLVGEDGATHQGTFDVGFLSQIPNLTLYAPASLDELESMLSAALADLKGPVAIRYPRGGEGAYNGNYADCDFAVLRPGNDACLLTYGTLTHTALETAERLAKQGLQVSVIKLNKLSPLPCDSLHDKLPKRFAVIEDVVRNGSVGQRMAAECAARGGEFSPVLFNLGQTFMPHGSITKQRAAAGLDTDSLTEKLTEAWCG